MSENKIIYSFVGRDFAHLEPRQALESHQAVMLAAIERKDAAIAELVGALKKLQYAYRQAAGLHDPNTGDAFTFVSHNAIAKYDTPKDGL